MMQIVLQGPLRGRGFTPPHTPHFLENYKELLRKSVFSPPLSNFESLVSPPPPLPLSK